MSTSSHSISSPTSAESGATSARRIVKTLKPLEPLAPEKRYVPIHSSHVSVFTGLFAWAIQQNRHGKRANRKVTFNQQSFGPNGLQAPTPQSRTKAQFNTYFALGTAKELRPIESGHHLNVHRNRLIFLTVLGAVVIYSLVWMTR
ncbi:MAG: hypothetical protein PF795_02790 [Kiritimatiellae bacterium]|jgi:hypothetical protein|nr:hypothetical protein [Kiritimatiellia bacterium]